MTFDSITNRGEFFSNHYLDAVIGGDLGDLRKQWDELERRGDATTRSRLKGDRSAFFSARAQATETSPANRPAAIKHLNDIVLRLLGFEPNRETREFKRNTVDLITLAVATSIETSTGLLLSAIDVGLADSVDDLFDEEATADPVAHPNSATLLLDKGARESDKKAIWTASDAIGELFAVDEPPRYVLALAGTHVLLAERAKWTEGRFLAVDLDAALERADAKAKGELETIAALFSADVLVPGTLDPDEAGGVSQFDELVENSHKHAVGVSKELREGIRESIEILANEVIAQLDSRQIKRKKKQFSRTDVDPRDLTTQCLRYLYRLLVLLYAESRPELGILPTDDETYMAGYSLDRLRELCLVDLDTDDARNGSHFDQSLDRLFELVNDGYHAEAAEQQLILAAATGTLDDQPSTENYLQFPGLNAGLFDDAACELLDAVTLRNEALQTVLRNLMVAEAKKKSDQASFISYAQLGINQLGAVYEGLMAYTGFFADQPLYEVAKKGDPTDGTWMLPVTDADDYPDDVFVTRTNPLTGEAERIRHETGGFVFRLSGRDRQRSASYYTPEVLTRCVVKHALAELLGLDDWAREPNGSANITNAVDLLDLTICEPALGSGAFLNEAINQLSAEYLRRRQEELGESLDPERYRHELQKVKAHYALHQSYGVDLNGTAVELAEVSLWLNAMHPGLKAPWFGLQLRQGNSLIGCRRAYWTVDQLADRPWAETRKDHVTPPIDHGLSEGALPEGAFHHFLVPAHGWASVATRKEAKELREEETLRLRDWRKSIVKGPKKADADRLVALAAAVEAHWARAAERIRLTQRALRRDLDLYGAPDESARATPIGRAEAERVLNEPDSPISRLRMLMDAWVGLWFWPLDSGETPPSWSEWLEVVEALLDVKPGDALPSGQLDLFDDLEALLEADAAKSAAGGRQTISELRADHPWLAIAGEHARSEGAWHWELDFAPAFERGGFDLQVGNPPWVRLDWKEDLVLAEFDPWWGVVEKPSTAVKKARRSNGLATPSARIKYLADVESIEGVTGLVGCPILRPTLEGVRTNLYMVFMDTTWRNMAPGGSAGMLHPEGHFVDPKAAGLRTKAYGHLRRHFQFLNGLFLFEDIHDMNVFGVQIYGQQAPTSFRQISGIQSEATIGGSLNHDGTGELPSIQYPEGGWDLRPHAARVLTIDETVLAEWARLFDEPGTPAAEARLLRPITTADLEALSVLADQPTRLADHDYHWTQGWNETNAKTDGMIEWETTIPDSWDEVILQGPHFTIATPFNKQPNENCQHNQDYSEWDLESLPERIIPRTNYQRACNRETYDANVDHWDGRPATEHWRHVHREMTQPGLERSVQGCIIPAGPMHINSCLTYSFNRSLDLVRWAGAMASIPFDYLVKASGAGHVNDNQIVQSPFPTRSVVDARIAVRVLRLNCLTADYAPLWEELAAERGMLDAWQSDSWTDDPATAPHRPDLGDVTGTWTMDTPLRRDYERRQALVELDALAAIMLGLTAEQLCAMYRTQFAVLRKYEHKMVFDAEGRKICGYHQSAGFRQSQLQDQAKEGDLPKDWKNLWTRYETWRDDESLQSDPTYWQDHFTPPFYPANREAEMTRAFESLRNPRALL